MTRNFHEASPRSLAGLPPALDLERLGGPVQPREGLALHALARTLAPYGPCLEVTGYRGKSALYLGSACKGTGSVLFAVDRHAEPGSTGPAGEGALGEFRRALHRAGLDDVVVPVVGPSQVIARHWHTPLALLLLDGGAGMGAMLADYRGWSGHIKWGGVLAIHGVFPNPADGPRAPYEIYKLALMSGLFSEIAMIRSLVLLRRMGGADAKI